jgi:hypothetical protein
LATAIRINAIRIPLFSIAENEIIKRFLKTRPVNTINENMIKAINPIAIRGLNLMAEIKLRFERAITQCVPPHVRQGMPVIRRKRQGGKILIIFPNALTHNINTMTMIPQIIWIGASGVLFSSFISIINKTCPKVFGQAIIIVQSLSSSF